MQELSHPAHSPPLKCVASPAQRRDPSSCTATGTPWAVQRTRSVPIQGFIYVGALRAHDVMIRPANHRPPPPPPPPLDWPYCHLCVLEYLWSGSTEQRFSALRILPASGLSACQGHGRVATIEGLVALDCPIQLGAGPRNGKAKWAHRQRISLTIPAGADSADSAERASPASG